LPQSRAESGANAEGVLFADSGSQVGYLAAMGGFTSLVSTKYPIPGAAAIRISLSVFQRASAWAKGMAASPNGYALWRIESRQFTGR